MAATLGPRPGVVARELTKTFETVRPGTLAELAEAYAVEGSPRGEIVVLAGPPADEAPSVADADALLAELLGRLPLSRAVAEAAAVTGLKRRDLYQRALAMKGDDAKDDDGDD
jgi:16S rRNA (cytidine1402-2'-O)-methyltransferase